MPSFAPSSFGIASIPPPTDDRMPLYDIFEGMNKSKRVREE
jgi:hypothetical protein